MRDSHLFEYIPCSSPLYRLNPMVKILALIVICIVSAALSPLYVFILLPALIPLYLLAGRSSIRQLGASWRLYIFFFFSGLVKYFTSGSIIEGSGFSAMLLIMFSMGLLFYTTTRISDFRSAAASIFGLIPFINGERIASLIAMTMAFLPLIFKTSSELKEAEYSRGFEPRKKPMRTLKLRSIPLLINLFLKTEEMTDTYYSRCYDAGPKK